MAGMLDGLMQQLGGGTLQKVGNTLGTDEATTGSAVSAALPILMAALARNASSPDGANALATALDRDHDGSALDNVSSLLDGPQAATAQASGQKMLGHILGGGQQHVAGALGAATGLDAGKASKLLMILAPMVLAYLGRTKREKGLDAGGLGSMLGTERAEIGARSGTMGSLLSMLDRDKDGSVVDDLGGMMGKMLGR
ncbi:MAG: DUF937 domain-containing protein [Gemmatimonadota bacterium]